MTELDVVTRDRYVKYEKKYTEPPEKIKLPPDFDNMSEGAAAKALGVAWRQQEEQFKLCVRKLETIEWIGGTLPEPGE